MRKSVETTPKRDNGDGELLPCILSARPVGMRLTMTAVPSPATRRWTALRKAEVVTAVRGGLMSVDAACAVHVMSKEELLDWIGAWDQHGLKALRATRRQRYRAASEPRPPGEAEC